MRMRSAWRRFSFRHSTPRAASRALRWNRRKALAAMSVETESLQGVARAQCRARNLNSANARLDKAARSWGDRWDSNPQQPESQSGTLPLSYGHRRNQRSGLPGGTRTHNPQLRRLVLYPVELRAAAGTLDPWSGWRDLNTRHLAPKASALPGCATPRKRRQMILSDYQEGN